MTTIDGPADGRRGPGGGDPWLLYLPAGWVAVVMALCAYGIWSSWPVIFDNQLPASIAYFIYATIAASVVTILWGSYILALALRRSPHFPRNFIFWQIADIAWSLLIQAYALIVPDFGFSLDVLARVGVEIAIGLFCIQLARGASRSVAGDALSAAAVQTGPVAGTRPSFLVLAALALLGVVLGGVLGFGAGLLAGIGLVEINNISCFEGACGYFAFFLGFAGLVAGAVGGGIFAVWRGLRRRRSAA
jgi:hypothetical protein